MPTSIEKQSARRREHLRRAVLVLDALKVRTGCRDCGFDAHPQALQFDHRDPMTKRAELGWVDDRSKLTTPDRLARYLDHVETYCDVRCANCHAIRSAVEQHWRGGHRTPPEAGLEALF